MDVKRFAPVLGPRCSATLTALLAVFVLLLAGAPGSADAAPQSAPAWSLRSVAQPTDLRSATAGEGYEIFLQNVGSLSSSGVVTVTDTLPAGVTTSSQAHGPGSEGSGEWECTPGAGQSVVTCTLAGPIAALGQAPTIVVPVTVAEGVSGLLLDQVHVSGGGPPALSASTASVVDASPPPFGLAGFSANILGPDGMPDTQAADHPSAFTMTLDLNSAIREAPDGHLQPTSVHDLKDVVFDLPPGFLASALATPTCTFAQLASVLRCPSDSRVGDLHSEPQGAASVDGPLYNMVPERGVAAEFGFSDTVGSTHALYGGIAPTPAGYVFRLIDREIPQIALTDLVATIYGDPAAIDESSEAPLALLTNPSVCTGAPLPTTAHLDSWQAPGPFADNGTPGGAPQVDGANWVSVTSQAPAMLGCDQLSFQPDALSVKPDTTTANSPTGLSLDLHTAQSQTPATLATPPLRDASVLLPAGLTLDPSLASGLQACTEAQIGWLGHSLTNFTPDPPSCPDASKIGSIEMSTPLLPGVLTGSIYLAAQGANPFGSLLAGYVVIDDAATGIVVKIPVSLTPSLQTGQITAAFDENPQLPISDLNIRFSGGPRGVLATPEGCGTYTTTSDLSPWSAPQSGPAATPSDSFPIDTGCVSGFAPAFSAGTIDPQAGASSPLTLSISRSDSQQGLDGLSVALPKGLLAKLAGVAQCSGAQLATAASNTAATEQPTPSCPLASRIGAVQTAAGPGPNPFLLSGSAYLTGPYRGAPYGIALIVPALAGPLDLGTVVIRQALYIDPTDAHVTDVSDPLPTILQGIPLRIRSVDLTLDRPGFILNPTSCQPTAIAASAVSSTGARAPLSARFQAARCTALGFRPKLTASTPAHASISNGAALVVKIAYPQGAPGTQTSLAQVKLDLPRQLSARLTTIQRACLAATFQSNPAACPPASVIGHATVRTPILAAPLTGPLYFVSYGGQRFPAVVMLLQGSGVTIQVTGQTLIDKGVTSVDFASTPDVPIESLEVDLPNGPYSQLGANLPANARLSFCGLRLMMPTLLKAQNGAQIKQATRVAVQGCSRRISLSHKLRGRTLTVTVYAPQAGRLKLSGKGLSSATRTAKAQENVEVALKANRKARFATKLRLTFSPSKGPRQAKTVSLKA